MDVFWFNFGDKMFIDKRPQHCKICKKTKINEFGYCRHHASRKKSQPQKIIQKVKQVIHHTFAIGSRSFSPEKSKKLDYYEYIASPEWKEKSGVEKKKNPKCSFCNRVRILHVHHRTYARLGKEISGDLIVLCDECHKIFHQFYEYDGRVGHFVRSK